MVNKYLPYLFVLPEDDANRQLANGFYLNVDKIRQMYVLKVAGGWMEVLNSFTSVHINEMERDENRFMVLLIDFDNHPGRLRTAKDRIPSHLANRVFILGAKTNPEELRMAFRQANIDSYENIGAALARDCRDETEDTWRHDLLEHNESELHRLSNYVRPILFEVN